MSATFSLSSLLQARHGENYDLQARLINPAFAKVLGIIGFDRVYTQGEGQYLFDNKGQRYLDCIAGYGVFNLGRNHPVVNQALKDLLDSKYPNLVKMDAPLVSGLLAEALLKRSPGMERVFFANSGAEGVEAAIKFARAATGKSRFVFLDHAYHGLTYGALSLNGDEHFREGFGDLLSGCAQIALNDLDALERELKRGDVAAFIYEPIQGKGLFVPNDTFLTSAQDLCRKYGALTIADEVQTGMGRTGRFLALEHWNLTPDLIVLSKSLSGGQVPVSAVMGRAWIFDKVFSRLDRCVVHSSTFSQNAMAMVAGLAALHVLFEDKLIENAAAMGDLLMQGLRERFDRFEMLKDVRGKGLYIGIEFGEPKSMGLKMGWKLLHKADKGLFSQAIIMPLLDKHHILTQVAGHNMDTIKISPALCITRDDVAYFLNSFDEVVAACHRFPGPLWEVGAQLTKHAVM